MNNVIISTIIYSLVAEISGGGWAEQFFAIVRRDSIAHAGVISSIAISLACIFISFKLIKMYYDLVSDEQSGGFGGVRMWDILRPLTILALIITFGTWLGWLDGVCNSVSSSLTLNMNTIAVNSDELLKNKIEEFDENINALAQETWEQAKSTRTDADSAIKNVLESQGIKYNPMRNYKIEDGQLTTDYWVMFSKKKNSWRLEDLAKNGTQAEVDDMVEKINNRESAQSDNQKVLSAKKEFDRYFNWIQKGSSIIGTIFTWLFNLIFVIMMAFADLMLCLLAIFGPMAAALSILEPWKQSFTSWLGHYVEVSLWKPIGSAICWIVVRVKASVGNMALTAVMGMSDIDGRTSLLATVGAQCLILFAGIIAVTNVPSITNTVLSLGSMSDQFTNSAANATTMAMHAPGRGVKAIGGLRSSAAGKAASRAQAGQLSQIAQGVNKMAGGGGA